MRALVWTAPHKMELRDQATPDLQPGEVLIKVAYAGICGSELSGYLGHNALRVPPLVMGHELSGTITALGPEVKTLNPGLTLNQKVTVNPLFCTGKSELQERGLDQLCPTRQLLGAHRPGAYAEYVAVPASSITLLPQNVSLRQGALAEPVGCAIRIGELAGPVSAKSCLVIGAGPIGLLSLQVLLANRADKVFIVDLDRHRLAMGSSLGGEAIDPAQQDVVKVIREATHDRGVEVAVDAVGAAVTREQCISATMSTGTVILSGLHEETSLVPAADIIRREIVVRGSFAYSPANFATAVEMLSQKRFTLDPWIEEAPLSSGGTWFDRLIEAPGNVSKVLLTP